MDTRGPEATEASAHEHPAADIPKSLLIAEKGIGTSKDFRNLMSAIMSDVIAGRLTPGMTNAACNAGGKLLKMVELEAKYATGSERPRRVLTVAFEQTMAEIEEASGITASKARLAESVS